MNIIDPQTLQHILEEEDVLLVDVREAHEQEEMGYIASATHVPLREISCAKLLEPQQKKIVCYCLSGKRSSLACMRLMEEDPNLEVYNLKGGIMAWNAHGLPIVFPDA